MSSEEACWKCDQEILQNQKVMSCSTCKLRFHIRCVNVSEAKHEFLCNDGSDLLWFCKPCKQTTVSVINHVANLEIRIRKMESERVKEKETTTSLHNLVETLQIKVEELQHQVTLTETACNEELEGINLMINQMLSEVPNSDTLMSRFDNIEGHLEKCSCNYIESRVSQLELNQVNIKASNELLTTPDAYHIAAITNEMCERKKRDKSFVIHNLPEANEEQDLKSVSEIMEEIIQENVEAEIEQEVFTEKPRIYRLGRKTNSKPRTMKIHLRSTELCDQILSKARWLSSSTKYKSVVIQRDLTLLERQHLKGLVSEKRRRNNLAKAQNEESDWTIRDGILCRKSRDH